MSCEFVRRRLDEESLFRRRARRVLGPEDPQQTTNPRKICSLRRHLPGDELAVFQEEIEINTNSQVGAMWMRRGQQADVVTPDTNSNRYRQARGTGEPRKVT